MTKKETEKLKEIADTLAYAFNEASSDNTNQMLINELDEALTLARSMLEKNP